MIPTYTFQQAFPLQSVGYAAAMSVVLVILAVSAAGFLILVFGASFISGRDDDDRLKPWSRRERGNHA